MDASDELELETLSSRIPKLIGVLPDVMRDRPGSGEKSSAALSVMLAKLLDCMDPLRPVRGIFALIFFFLFAIADASCL